MSSLHSFFSIALLSRSTAVTAVRLVPLWSCRTQHSEGVEPLCLCDEAVVIRQQGRTSLLLFVYYFLFCWHLALGMTQLWKGMDPSQKNFRGKKKRNFRKSEIIRIIAENRSSGEWPINLLRNSWADASLYILGLEPNFYTKDIKPELMHRLYADVKWTSEWYTHGTNGKNCAKSIKTKLILEPQHREGKLGLAG